MLLSPLLKCNLIFGRSALFLRIVLVLYVLAIFMVWQSGFGWMLRILCSMLLIAQGIYWYKKPYPSGIYEKLAYTHGSWLLWMHKKEPLVIHNLRFLFDTGLFLILQCKGVEGQKNVLIFYDQLEEEDHRNLRRLVVFGRGNF